MVATIVCNFPQLFNKIVMAAVLLFRRVVVVDIFLGNVANKQVIACKCILCVWAGENLLPIEIVAYFVAAELSQSRRGFHSHNVLLTFLSPSHSPLCIFF